MELGRMTMTGGPEEVLRARLTRRRLMGATGLTAAAAAFLAACGGGDGGDAAADQAEADVTVTMLGSSSQTFHFEPEAIQLQSGVEVKLLFVNESAQPHSFRIDGLVDSGVIKNPGSEATSTESTILLTFTPTEPGEKMFYCSAHGPQSESGTVTIT
jgi:plastocyanin